MKTKTSIWGAMFLATACIAQTHFSQQEFLKIASEHLPQPTNSVSVTTNLLFFLSSDRYTSFPENQFKSSEVIYYGLLGASTNHIWYRHFPDGEYDFHLFDEGGKEVLKTKEGLALTGTPPKPSKNDLMFWKTSHFQPYCVDNKAGEYRRLFRPDAVFLITNKGTYELEIQMRLCVIMTNGLPDLSAMIDARNVTGQPRWRAE